MKVYGIIGAILTLLIPYFLMFFNDSDHLEKAQSLCPFKMLTGFPCPGCGITKSLVYLYEGDLGKSFSYHLFGPFAFIFCIALIVLLSAEILTGKEFGNKFFFSKKLAYSLAAVLILYHIGRITFFVRQHNSDEILKESIWR